MGEFIKVGKVSEIPEGTGKCVEVNGRRVGLFNLEGEVYAISDTCTHAEASLSEGDVDGEEIICPLHGAIFDLKSGEALAPPADEPVNTYKVRTNGDDIEIDMDSPADTAT